MAAFLLLPHLSQSQVTSATAGGILTHSQLQTSLYHTSTRTASLCTRFWRTDSLLGVQLASCISRFTLHFSFGYPMSLSRRLHASACGEAEGICGCLPMMGMEKVDEDGTANCGKE